MTFLEKIIKHFSKPTKQDGYDWAKEMFTSKLMTMEELEILCDNPFDRDYFDQGIAEFTREYHNKNDKVEILDMSCGNCQYPECAFPDCIGGYKEAFMRSNENAMSCRRRLEDMDIKFAIAKRLT